jgi:hypothetical protein
MKNLRNLKYLSILIIVTVWCIPAFASVSHLNCTCCTQTKSCCEEAAQNSVKIEKNDISCPKCKCNISEKSSAENTYLTTLSKVKTNYNTTPYSIVVIEKNVSAETEVVLSSHNIQLKYTPLFIKNSVFLL